MSFQRVYSEKSSEWFFVSRYQFASIGLVTAATTTAKAERSLHVHNATTFKGNNCILLGYIRAVFLNLNWLYIVFYFKLRNDDEQNDTNGATGDRSINGDKKNETVLQIKVPLDGTIWNKISARSGHKSEGNLVNVRWRTMLYVTPCI